MNYDTGHAITINNVQLPIQVVRELQRLGRALEWYSNGELNSAVAACAIDGNLIDDPHGVDFIDKLELTDAEKRKSQACNDDEEDRHKKCISDKIWGFCKRLKESRNAHGQHITCSS